MTDTDATLTTTITGYDVKRVESMLVAHLAQRFEKETLDAIQKEARGRAQARVKEITAETIDVEVRKVLTEGWEEVSTWGERTGKRFTLRSHIVEYLKSEQRENNHHGEPRYTPIQRAMKEAVAAVFSKEFEAEIDAARKTLRAQIDAAVAAKFIETIKSALGLR